MAGDELVPYSGRRYVGDLGTGRREFRVKRVYRRKDGTASSLIVTWEAPGVGGSTVYAEASVRMPKDGLLHGCELVV